MVKGHLRRSHKNFLRPHLATYEMVVTCSSSVREVNDRLLDASTRDHVPPVHGLRCEIRSSHCLQFKLCDLGNLEEGRGVAFLNAVSSVQQFGVAEPSSNNSSIKQFTGMEVQLQLQPHFLPFWLVKRCKRYLTS